MKQLAATLVERAQVTPDAVAVVDGSGAHTLGEVLAAAHELADSLAAASDGAPTVLLQADNTWRTLAASVAVGLRGGLVTVMSSHATAGEYELALEDIVPDAVVASDGTAAAWGVDVADLSAGARVLDGWALHARPGPTRGVERWDGGVAIAMTSGSTGRPKCVVQSEEAIRYAGRSTIEAVGLQPGDPVAALVPLSSVAAFCFGLYLPAMLGGPQVCLERWRPADALDVMEHNAVAWTMLVPTMALQLSLVPGSTGRLSSLKAMTVGGGPMNADALERAERALGTRFLRVFGMSECLGHTTAAPSDDATTRLDRDGRPFPGTDVRVVDEAGRSVPIGVEGRVQVSGPSLFLGYARSGRPQARELTPDGYLVTGDLARLHDDGSLSILGREKQIIIRGGRNIDINEVESALAALPQVAQVCVVPVPDEMLGERVAALVVTTSQLDLVTVQEALEASGFPKAKWPEFVHVVDDLPQNRVGKLNRPEAVSLAVRLSLQLREA
ncbi:class I adenylate-forming enzyme family protein [Nocardioides zeae]|uniref:Class I adenylate-forming enzyme family protein n=1 Tax=Nocardioides imazamoxiresistens TaxID=3231893 RepID=A0ABU3PVM0_9ACTN|nr:class I adenylate-forming enzyme family protein [Nocardioides zeae]MDT9593270.1 class I adenylate-forming enzyme family protein [Nocardioides zeae]